MPLARGWPPSPRLCLQMPALKSPACLTARLSGEWYEPALEACRLFSAGHRVRQVPTALPQRQPTLCAGDGGFGRRVRCRAGGLPSQSTGGADMPLVLLLALHRAAYSLFQECQADASSGGRSPAVGVAAGGWPVTFRSRGAFSSPGTVPALPV